MIGIALRNLKQGFCVLNKPAQAKPYQKQVQFNSFTYDVINHYDQICKLRGKGGIISLLPCYPQYQVTKQGPLVVKMKYSRNYVYLWRFQPIADAGKEVNNKDSLNFPVSYENCGNLLDLCDHLPSNPEVKLEESTVKGNLTFQVAVNYENREAHLSLNAVGQSSEQRYDVHVSLAQYKLICEQMRQGLPLVTGWIIPDKFLVEINQNKDKQE